MQTENILRFSPEPECLPISEADTGSWTILIVDDDPDVHAMTGFIRILTRIESEDVVSLRYSDDGKGFAEGDVSRAFDPFFTTKRGSGGSGLGLHIAYNLVVGALGGTVSLTSAPGGGALFLIRFPRRISSNRRI